VLGPEGYNRVFTMHGTTMIFLFATPMVTGLGIYFVPLMLGTRDMAFPRLNALGYWVVLLAGLFIYSGFLAGTPPDIGWFAYPPLSGLEFTPTLAADFYALGVIFIGISTTIAAINFITTALKLRAPGMAVHRVPLFVWGIFDAALTMLIAVPALTLAAVLLELDRRLGAHFYDPAQGGSPILWQHLFWFWGHPEVYILLLPALGVISTVIAAYARRPVMGYSMVVTASLAISILSFSLWVHHMFSTGLALLSISFFTASSFAISIASGITIFAGFGTMWYGKNLLRTPMMFALGFIVTFVLGGITGVMAASVPFDWQVHDTFFVVAHFHYVLVGGVLFPIIAALYYWFPKVTGRMYNEVLGHISF
jgi:cytochrome c oxidase subunit I+III